MSNISPELHSFELIHCPSHPEFRVEAFCTKDNFHPALLCIKCLLSPEISKEIRGELATIKDVISRSVEDKNPGSFGIGNTVPEISNESLEQKVLELSTKDYIEVFERQIETQMKKLDREIDRVRESLRDLRSQFVKFFEKQTQALKVRDEEIKRRVYQYFEEKDELGKMDFETLTELLRKLRSIHEYEHYERFIRILFKKASSSEEGEGSMTKRLINMIDEIKTQGLNIKSIRIDTHILEEIRERIDAINILDKSTPIAGASSLESKLDSTLEKLRNIEKKSIVKAQGTTPPGLNLEKKNKDSSEKHSPYSDKELQKPSRVSQILKEKYGIEIDQKSGVKPHIDREYPVQKKHFQGEDKAKPTDLSTIKSILSSIKIGKSTPIDSAQNNPQHNQTAETKKIPYEPKSPMLWHDTKKSLGVQDKPEKKTQMIIQNEPSDDNHMEEESRSNPVINKDTNLSYRKRSSENVSWTPGGSGVDSSIKTSVNQTTDKAGTQPHLSSYPKYTQNTQHQKPDQYRRSSTSPMSRDLSRSNDNFDYSPRFPKTIDKQPSYSNSQQTTDRGKEHTQSQGRDIRNSQSMESEDNNQSRGQSAFSKLSSKELAKSAPESENSRANIINQWIDQKVNGFLVFQNTLRDQAPSHVKDFGNYAREKWFLLSKPERDEYTILALEVRIQLKQELKDLSLSTSDLSQLQQILDDRIKQLKK